MSRAAKNRWQAMFPEQRLAQMAKMRAARQPDFAQRALETRRQNRANQVLGTINRSRDLRSISSTRSAIWAKLIFSNSAN